MNTEDVKATVEECDGVFQGIQMGFPELNIEPLVLFAKTTMSTTHALPVSQFSPQAVRAKLSR
jgi:hypothetical protein